MDVRHIIAEPAHPRSNRPAIAYCGVRNPGSGGCTVRDVFCPTCKEERRQHHEFLKRVANGLECPECGGPVFNASGCSFCPDCGWERC
jgi:hypothetical protein